VRKRRARSIATGKGVSTGSATSIRKYDAQVFGTSRSRRRRSTAYDGLAANWGYDRSARTGARRLPHANARPGGGQTPRRRWPKVCPGTGKDVRRVPDRIDGTLAPNAGLLVVIRRFAESRWVIERRHGRSAPEDLDAMCALLDASLAFRTCALDSSRSWARTHNDAPATWVPSRIATEDRDIAVCSVVSGSPTARQYS